MDGDRHTHTHTHSVCVCVCVCVRGAMASEKRAGHGRRRELTHMAHVKGSVCVCVYYSKERTTQSVLYLSLCRDSSNHLESETFSARRTPGASARGRITPFFGRYQLLPLRQGSPGVMSPSPGKVFVRTAGMCWEPLPERAGRSGTPQTCLLPSSRHHQTRVRSCTRPAANRKLHRSHGGTANNLRRPYRATDVRGGTWPAAGPRA